MKTGTWAFAALVVLSAALAGCNNAAPPPADVGEGATAMIAVQGEAVAPAGAEIPAGAVLRVVALDVARQDAAAPELARTEAPAANGPSFPFTIAIPREGLTEQSRVAVRAQILQGYRILYTSTQHHGVALDGGNSTLRIDLSAVADVGTGAGGHPVTPTPQGYTCGGELLQIAVQEGAAYVTSAGGDTVRLDRLSGEADPAAPRLFTNGRATLRVEAAGSAAPVLSFARGRAAFLPCRRT